MIRLSAVRAPLDATQADWPGLAAAQLRVPPASILSCRLARRAVDARRRGDVHLVLALDIEYDGDEAALLGRLKGVQAKLLQPVAPPAVIRLDRAPALRPIVVGSGPAGLFAALTLAQAGARPLLVERGRDAATRRRDIAAFWQGGPLDPASNVQFGEGGAGTFSDGKLNTGIKDARCRQVLETFVACGAPEEILWQAKPHVGTDYLIRVVQALRGKIEALGGTVLFETQLTGLRVQDGMLRGADLNGQAHDAELVILCVGHSARDTFAMLHAAGVRLEAKPFSIGARIEHPQPVINRAQYGAFAGHPQLSAADYRLATHLPGGRGVYTFCMCPGGVVVASASQADGVVTNGMSRFARDGTNANSALLVDVRPEDYGGAENPLAGIGFQRQWERAAFALGGGTQRAPAQRVDDFLAGRPSRAWGGVAPSYRPGVTPADLRGCLPGFAADSMAEALRAFDRMLPGFAMADAVLTGVETRSSSPVRIVRDARGVSSLRGLYPAGEGAGYAGGIMSAAVDGIRAAGHALQSYQQPEEFE